MPRITNKADQEFYQYISERMSHADFNKLHEILGLGKRKTTSFLYYPETIDFPLLNRLSELVKEDLTQVIDRFKIGTAVYSHKKYEELTSVLKE